LRRRRARETVIAKQAEIQEEEELWKKKEEELKARKKESRTLVGESIRRELAESKGFLLASSSILQRIQLITVLCRGSHGERS
jgi:hypothetical protein